MVGPYRFRGSRIGTLLGSPLVVATFAFFFGLPEARAEVWAPSVAVAGIARSRDGLSADVAVDLRLEALFGDSGRPRIGGFVDGRLTGRAEPSFGAGLSVSLPTSSHDAPTSFVLSSGAAVHARGGDVHPAVLARVFWGLRSVPQGSSRYEIAVGLWTEARYFPRDRSLDVLFGVTADFYALSLPFVYLASAFR